MVVLATRFDKLGFEVSTDLLKDGSKPLDGIHVKDPMAILGDKDQVNVKLKYTMSTTSNFTYNSHGPSVRWESKPCPERRSNIDSTPIASNESDCRQR